MKTPRQQIIDAAVAAINANAPDGFPLAEPARVLKTDTSAFPAVLVYRASETESEATRNPTAVRRELHFKVHVRVATDIDTDDSPEELAEPFLDHVWEALTGNKLGGLVASLKAQSTDWTLDISDVGICEGVIEFVAEYAVALPRRT